MTWLPAFQGSKQKKPVTGSFSLVRVGFVCWWFVLVRGSCVGLPRITIHELTRTNTNRNSHEQMENRNDTAVGLGVFTYLTDGFGQLPLPECQHPRLSRPARNAHKTRVPDHFALCAHKPELDGNEPVGSSG